MKRQILKAVGVLAALAVAALTIAGTSVRALAADTVGGEEVTFDKYLVMDQNANVPNVTFTFKAEAGSAVNADKGKGTPAVKAGIGTPEVGNAVFTAPDDAAEGTKTYSTAADGDSVALAAGQKYAKQTVTVDLSDITFTEPGIYRYVITEEASAAEGITNDAVSTRILDVYVVSDENGNLSIAGNVLHKSEDIAGNTGGDYGDKKDSGFTNSYATKDLTISKKVTGNQGFRNKYFAFTVKISGAAPETKYDVDLTGATSGSIAGADATNPSSLYAGVDGSVTETFYLKNGESIIVRGLTAGTKYTVSEENEDYTASWALDNGGQIPGNSTGERSMGGESHSVEFTNHREGAVPTGILVDVAPYLIMVLIACGACALLFGRKRRKR